MTDVQSLNIINTLQNGRTDGILLETMELVDGRIEKPVPNRLLDSKIYAKVSQNATVKATPSTIYFAGFEAGQTLKVPLRIGNVDSEVIRMHIIPPQSKFFNIKYKKQERLVPGMTLDCTVEFYPDEWRYYYDCIRIHTKGDENLIIPIHAYPVLDTSTFPQIMTFPPVAVGHKKSKIIPLRCDVPIDFEFQLSYLHPHPAFTIDPMTGVIPANGEIEVTVTYSPVEFSTSRMICQLNVSQFNFKPLICTCTGTSTPGLAREQTEKAILKELTIVQNMEDTLNILDPRAISPLDRARLKKKTTGKKKTKNGFHDVAVPSRKEIEIEGIHFPPNLNTPHAVAQVLNQTPGKLRAKDYREAMDKKDMETSSRQMKEAIFDHAVKKNVYEERQNQLRWQVKIGETQISADKKADVLSKRKDAWEFYRFKRGDPVLEEEYTRTCTGCVSRRTVRDSEMLADDKAQFDTYTNNPWATRHSALNRFAQAGRTVILRLRADKKIKGIRQMVLTWKKKKFVSSATEQHEEPAEEENTIKLSVMSADKIQSVQFPHYSAPNKKDDMAPDSLGPVPVETKEPVIKKKVYYGDLVVPRQYTLLSYQAHNVHETSHGYVPFQLVKKLRTGAEDEVISLESTEASDAKADKPDSPVNEGDMHMMDVDYKPVPPPVEQILELTPPEALFKPIDYPPLHIFNPAPGLQVFQAPLPYAEVEPDYHLCPMPRYPKKETENQPHASTQKQYLDREDVIKSVMTWKKFPSQGLTSLANTPTLSNVWVPRWSDPFNSDILPNDVPPLLDALPEEDRENIYEEAVEMEDGENLTQSDPIQLTPEMVTAMFPSVSVAMVTEEKPNSDMFPNGNKMPATNIPVSNTGPVPREKREQEIDYFLNKKYNKLGQKIQGRVDMMNSITTKNDLELK